MALLETRGLEKSFGGVQVAHNINFTLESGEIHCLIGPNGAGKSTFFKLLLGVHQPSEGQILFDGDDITNLKPSSRIKRGISIKFQVPGIFKTLSVHQNLVISLQRHKSGSEMEVEIERLLDFIGLKDDSQKMAGNLSHGQQQWLEIGMAISLEPRLLLLDEPTAGMSPEETEKTGQLVRKLAASGITILAVEHDMAFVRQIAENITVLHFGEIFAQGNIESIMANEGVAEIYLGKSDDD